MSELEETYKYDPQTIVFYSEHFAVRNNGDEYYNASPLNVRNYANFRNGRENPLWRSQVANHNDATTFLAGEKFKVSTWKWHGEEHLYWVPPYDSGHKIRFNKVKANALPAFFLTWDPVSINETKADNQAKMQFVSKLRDSQTTFGGSTFVAESIQTLRLFKNPLGALRKEVRRFEKRMYKTSLRRHFSNLSQKKRREILADLWLEYSFGWRPLINDIDDFVKTVAYQKYMTPPEYLNVFGVGESKRVAARSSTYIGTTNPYVKVNYRRVEHVEVKYLGQWEHGTHVLRPDPYGFTADNWALAAWEIVPWSFLIDYFTNAGDLISAASMARSGERWTLRTSKKSMVFEPEGHEVINTASWSQCQVTPGYQTLSTLSLIHI